MEASRFRSDALAVTALVVVGLGCHTPSCMGFRIDVSQARRAALALGLAFFAHGGLILWGARSPQPLRMDQPLQGAVNEWQVEFHDEPNVSRLAAGAGEQTPGGGSVDRGTFRVSAALAAVPAQSPKPVQLANRVAREHLARPAPVTHHLESSEEMLAAEADKETDLFAVDSVLSADDGQAEFAVRLRPTTVRTLVSQTQAAAPERSRPSAVSQKVNDSAAFGLGAGSRGGRGGNGAGFGDGRGSFGGSTGHFRGQVCFIEPGTRALRQLGNCEVVGEFYTDVFNVTPRSFTAGFPGVSERTEWFAILYTGSITAPEAGRYRFRVRADDGAILRIDGKVVVDNDGQHGPVSVEAVTRLDSGEHAFELRYFQGPRTTVALQVFVTPPTGDESLLRGQL